MVGSIDGYQLAVGESRKVIISNVFQNMTAGYEIRRNFVLICDLH